MKTLVSLSQKCAAATVAVLWVLVLALISPIVSVSQGPAHPMEAGYTLTRLFNGSWLAIASIGGQVSALIVDGHNRQVERAGTMVQRRNWHTATALPDGRVLIAGGIDAGGHVLSAPEIFDPGQRKFEALPQSGMTPRARHSATLLTDGTVLLAGGVSEDGTPLRSADLWDYRTGTGRKLESEMLAPLAHPASRMLPDGSVLVWEGAEPDRTGGKEEIYVPQSRSFQAWYIGPRERDGLELQGSVPDDQAVGIPLEGIIGLRFSRQLNIDSVNASTITLSDGADTLEAWIVPAEQGRLVFVTPRSPLAPNKSYTLAINGVKDEQGNVAPYAARTFFTGTNSPAGVPGSLPASRVYTPGVRTGMAFSIRPFAIDASKSTTIKAFVECLNAAMPGDINATAACIPGGGACTFTVTKSSESLQPACNIAGIDFPRIILDCPGPTANRRFRPSYLLCPTSDQRNHVEVGEDGQDITFTLDRDDQKNTPGMVMGDITVGGAFRPLTEEGVAIFGKDLNTPKNTCQSSCHYTVKNNGKNERAWMLPINPIGTIRGGGTNLAPLVIFANIDLAKYPTKGLPKGSDKKANFTNVCNAIGNPQNQKKVMKAEPGVTAATLTLMTNLCGSLVAKVK